SLSENATMNTCKEIDSPGNSQRDAECRHFRRSKIRQQQRMKGMGGQGYMYLSGQQVNVDVFPSSRIRREIDATEEVCLDNVNVNSSLERIETSNEYLQNDYVGEEMRVLLSRDDTVMKEHSPVCSGKKRKSPGKCQRDNNDRRRFLKSQ
ncbi:hypothetical protein KI387_043435, partial [Taxus chinensis]